VFGKLTADAGQMSQCRRGAGGSRDAFNQTSAVKDWDRIAEREQLRAQSSQQSSRTHQKSGPEPVHQPTHGHRTEQFGQESGGAQRPGGQRIKAVGSILGGSEKEADQYGATATGYPHQRNSGQNQEYSWPPWR
jgi:hypothetical protein